MSKMFKYYYDLMSQPSRALWITLKLSKTPYEDCPVPLRKFAQRTEEFKKINRFQKVPALIDGNFQLSESIAILRYLDTKGVISDQLYPKDPQQRARTDEFLEWYHLGLRYGCSWYFMHLWLLPQRGDAAKPSEKEIAELRDRMESQLKSLEHYWLKDTPFLTGNKPTFADLMGACEIEQTKLCNYNVRKEFPKIGEWLDRVQAETNPYYEEAHKFINKAASKL